MDYNWGIINFSAYYFFLEPSKLVTGGVTGLMIMLEPFFTFPTFNTYVYSKYKFIVNRFIFTW